MKRDYYDYVEDILNSINETEEFVEGLGFDEFKGNKKTVNAVIRSLEVIGEAAKKIPEGLRKRFGDVPWNRMAGMRDKLIHEYHGVDLEIVWAVLKEELPPLKPKIEKILETLEKESR